MLVFPLTSKVYDEEEALPIPVFPTRVLDPLSVDAPLTAKLVKVPCEVNPGAEVMLLPSALDEITCDPPTQYPFVLLTFPLTSNE